MNQVVGTVRRALIGLGVAASVVLLSVFSVVALTPTQSGAATSLPHTGSTCTQTGDFPYGSAVVGMAATPDDGGYWIVTNDGYVAACGDAPYLGEQTTLNAPIVGIAATPDGGGYYLVASDGGIFTFGDAHFQGSTGSIHLNKPVVGMATDAASNGYWLVASDGGVFAYNAPFYGSTGSIVLNKPIVGMEATASGSGYRFIAADGGIFDYGTSGFYGTPVFAPPPAPAPTPGGGGGASPSCSITLSNYSPPDGYQEAATIASNQPNASVTITKYYKTTTTTDTGTTDSGGNASIDFNISGATAGYPVRVVASVGSAGCSTSFTPT